VPRIIGNFLAFYRVEETEVVVMRVMHGKRDITADDIAS